MVVNVPLTRRTFLSQLAAGAGALALSTPALAARPRRYHGPNVILVRYGGGVRRRETIVAEHSYSPYLVHELIPRGTLYPKMEISNRKGVQTSHGPGTLNILTGIYDHYTDVLGRPLGERFEAQVPTLFEYVRKNYVVEEHEALIVNGEDRINEEFYTFSSHHRYGVQYRSNVLSLHRFKMHLLREKLKDGGYSAKEGEKLRRKLAEMEVQDHRVTQRGIQSPTLHAFWDAWRDHYGDSGFKNPRGDRLLTELSLWALKRLRPKFMMVNYNDCDYVHWGNPSHYTRGIQIMDEGLKRLVEAVDHDEAMRDNTVFVVVPDCGRDNNRLVSVPFQHHFNSDSSREVFALVFGAGVARGQIVDKTVQQISIAKTIGALMGFDAAHAKGPTLEEAIA